MTRVIICVILMAIVTYIPRALPITVFRKKIKSKICALVFGLYAVCGAWGTDLSGHILFDRSRYLCCGRCCGGNHFAYFKRSLVEVAVAAIAVVYVAEMLL